MQRYLQPFLSLRTAAYRYEYDDTRAICRGVFHTRFFAERKEEKRGKEKERRQKTFLSTKEHRYSPSLLLPLFCCLRIFPSGPYIMFFSIVFLARREYRVPQRENLSFCSTANRLMPEIYRRWWSCLHVDKVDFSIIRSTYFPFFFFFYRWIIDRSIEGLKWWTGMMSLRFFEKLFCKQSFIFRINLNGHKTYL